MATIQKWLAGAGVLLALFLGALTYGYRAGAANETTKRERKDALAAREVRQIDKEIDRLSADGVNDRLSKWVRD